MQGFFLPLTGEGYQDTMALTVDAFGDRPTFLSRQQQGFEGDMVFESLLREAVCSGRLPEEVLRQQGRPEDTGKFDLPVVLFEASEKKPAEEQVQSLLKAIQSRPSEQSWVEFKQDFEQVSIAAARAMSRERSEQPAMTSVQPEIESPVFSDRAAGKDLLQPGESATAFDSLQAALQALFNSSEREPAGVFIPTPVVENGGDSEGISTGGTEGLLLFRKVPVEPMLNPPTERIQPGEFQSFEIVIRPGPVAERAVVEQEVPVTSEGKEIAEISSSPPNEPMLDMPFEVSAAKSSNAGMASYVEAGSVALIQQVLSEFGLQDGPARPGISAEEVVSTDSASLFERTGIPAQLTLKEGKAFVSFEMPGSFMQVSEGQSSYRPVQVNAMALDSDSVSQPNEAKAPAVASDASGLPSGNQVKVTLELPMVSQAAPEPVPAQTQQSIQQQVERLLTMLGADSNGLNVKAISLSQLPSLATAEESVAYGLRTPPQALPLESHTPADIPRSVETGAAAEVSASDMNTLSLPVRVGQMPESGVVFIEPQVSSEVQQGQTLSEQQPKVVYFLRETLPMQSMSQESIAPQQSMTAPVQTGESSVQVTRLESMTSETPVQRFSQEAVKQVQAGSYARAEIAPVPVEIELLPAAQNSRPVEVRLARLGQPPSEPVATVSSKPEVVPEGDRPQQQVSQQPVVETSKPTLDRVVTVLNRLGSMLAQGEVEQTVAHGTKSEAIRFAKTALAQDSQSTRPPQGQASGSEKGPVLVQSESGDGLLTSRREPVVLPASEGQLPVANRSQVERQVVLERPVQPLQANPKPESIVVENTVSRPGTAQEATRETLPLKSGYVKPSLLAGPPAEEPVSFVARSSQLQVAKMGSEVLTGVRSTSEFSPSVQVQPKSAPVVADEVAVNLSRSEFQSEAKVPLQSIVRPQSPPVSGTPVESLRPDVKQAAVIASTADSQPVSTVSAKPDGIARQPQVAIAPEHFETVSKTESNMVAELRATSRQTFEGWQTPVPENGFPSVAQGAPTVARSTDAMAVEPERAMVNRSETVPRAEVTGEFKPNTEQSVVEAPKKAEVPMFAEANRSLRDYPKEPVTREVSEPLVANELRSQRSNSQHQPVNLETKAQIVPDTEASPVRPRFQSALEAVDTKSVSEVAATKQPAESEFAAEPKLQATRVQQAEVTPVEQPVGPGRETQVTPSFGSSSQGESVAEASARLVQTPRPTAFEQFVQTESFVEQIVARTSDMVQSGRNEMRVQLEPEHLGQMRMSVIVEDQKLMARIVVDSSEARNMLERNLPALQQSLATQGLRVQEIRLTVAGSEEFSFSTQHSSQQRHDSPGHEPSGQRGNERSFSQHHAQQYQDSLDHRSKGQAAVRQWESLVFGDRRLDLTA